MSPPSLPGSGGRPHLIALFALLVAGGCFIFRRVDVEPLPSASATVQSPVKAHLADGSTVVYPAGLTIARDTVRGAGTRWNLTLSDSGPVGPVPLDSVLAMEVFRTRVNVAATVLPPVLVLGGLALYCGTEPKRCFGSCPTFYSDSAGLPVLEAEGFSYAISPLLETRDVDRLRTGPLSGDVVRLEVRNEALETHYLNHLELLEVRHEPGETVLPDRLRRPVAVRDLAPAAGVRDRAGRDVSARLASADGVTYETPPERLAAVTAADPLDWLDISIPVDVGVDTLALTLRLRNSLLTTVLLYDLMLGDRGPRALDWLGRDLRQLGTVVELGRWAVETLGLRLRVPDGSGWRTVGRFGDAGPIAWKDVALLVPVSESPQRVRIEFVADNWRIDHLAAAARWRRPAVRGVPVARGRTADGRPLPEIASRLAAADERYLATSAGQRFGVEFDVGPVPPHEARTFLLASQGWYTEWIRGSWLARGRDTTVFRPGPAAILAALERWRASREETEREFYSTRVPTR